MSNQKKRPRASVLSGVLLYVAEDYSIDNFL